MIKLKHACLYLLFVTLMLVPCMSYAQTDTSYYNIHGQRLGSKVWARGFSVTKKYNDTVHVSYYNMPSDILDEYVFYGNDSVNYYYTEYYRGKGTKMYEGAYVGEQKEGVWLGYNNDGTLRIRKVYHEGLLVDTLLEYYNDGTIKRKIVFQDYLIAEDTSYNSKGEVSTDPPRVFTYVEQMPKCPYNISTYIIENFSPPKNSTTRRVLAKFVVDEEGDILNIEILSKDIDIELKNEVLRLLSRMPAWHGGKQNGKPVKVFYTLPISYKTSED